MAVLACSLAMDTFAVSLVFGTGECLLRARQVALVALIFALVQSSFITAAWLGGHHLANLISSFDHWVAFILLALVGVHLLREGKAKIYMPLAKPAQGADSETGGKASPPECDAIICRLGRINQDSFLPASLFTLLGLAVATSIDSLGAGVGVSLLGSTGWILSLLVFFVTFMFSAAGAFLGRKARSITRMGGWACVFGGMILLSMGMDILYKHGVFD